MSFESEDTIRESSEELRASEKAGGVREDAGLIVRARTSLYRFQGSREHLDNCTEQEIRELAESEAVVNESTSVYHED